MFTCNCSVILKRSLLFSRDEISIRFNELKFQPGLKISIQSAPKAYCVNIMVDIKPFSLNKGCLFQNKICYVDKIYLCFAKIKFSKHTLYRSSRPELFCEKGVLRSFAKFTGKHLYQSFFFNKVGDLRPASLLKKRPWHS